MNIYTYEESLAASTEYFGNDLSARAFVDKYALRNENDELLELTPTDMHHRIAKELARVEKNKFKNPMTEEEIFSHLDKFKSIIPQGSPMYGIGNKYTTVSLSNCFVCETPEDSYGSIMKTDEQLVQLSKRRCGIGISLDKLRPEGTPTKNSAKSSTGILSWMERYSHSVREVGQHSRRGALMLTLNVHHPQILDFINAKRDNTKITGANVSVQYTDEFLNAVKNNEMYEQRWPIDSKNPKITKQIKAKTIWDAAVKASWESAEPGLQFIDIVKKESPADCYENFQTHTSNPCIPGWGKVLTKNGTKDIKEIEKNELIWTQEGWKRVVKKFANGLANIYKYQTTAGTFYSTKNHKIVNNKKKISIHNSDSIDILVGEYIHEKELDPQIIMDGLVFGDGGIHKASNNLIGLYIGRDDFDYFNNEINNLIKKHRPGVSEEFYTIKTNITANELVNTYNRTIPNRYMKDRKTICSFLRGVYSANGSVCGNRITLKSSSIKVIEATQLMLSLIGISSYYTTNKSKEIEFSNGSYQCKESYDLNISTDREKFVNSIGFIQQYKNNKITIVKSNKKKNNYNIISRTLIGKEEVFDLQIENSTHTYWCNGFNVSNCSEIFLSVLDSCRLLAINLFCCVKNPYTKDAFFDFNLLTEKAKIAQRLMDDIIDLEEECINRIIQKIKHDPESLDIKNRELDMWKTILEVCKEGRRTGTGITAIGDSMAAIGIKYGSNDSIEFSEKIYKTLKLGAYRSSVDMAKELGPFPAWDYEKEKDNPFLLRIKDDDPKLYSDMKKYGRRNIAILTTAPTGTVSMMASLDEKLHGTTSGIEPLFKTNYTRRKKGNPGDNDFRSDFIDQNGDNWMEFDVYHPGVEMWMKITNETNIKQSPYIEADKINWTNRVKIQAAAQKHVDHSISATVNLPNDVQEKEVAKIFLEAWTNNLKGITVYRDGCRTGVLVSKKENSENKITKTQAPKRPTELECDVYHISVKGVAYFVLVGLFYGEPYEIFAGKNNVIDKKVKKGKIIKQKRGRYKAIFDDESELAPIGAFTSDEEDTLTRLISAALRHGTSTEFLTHQLEKAKGDLQSFSKSLLRALKKYIPNGTEVKGEECPECHSLLIRTEGCRQCLGCGWSKC